MKVLGSHGGWLIVIWYTSSENSQKQPNMILLFKHGYFGYRILNFRRVKILCPMSSCETCSPITPENKMFSWLHFVIPTIEDNGNWKAYIN